MTLTIAFETTDRDQLIARIREFVQAIPASAITQKTRPLIGIISSNVYGCGKSLIWDVFTETLLAKKALEEDSSKTYLNGDEDLLGPEENLNGEVLNERNAEIWFGKHRASGSQLRLHYYNALDLTPFFELQMSNDINNTHDPRVEDEYLPNLVLMTNRDQGPVDFFIMLSQDSDAKKWELKTKISIFSEELQSHDAIANLSEAPKRHGGLLQRIL